MNFAEQWQEARAIVLTLARCESGIQDDHWRPIMPPADVDLDALLRRAKRLAREIAECEREEGGE